MERVHLPAREEDSPRLGRMYYTVTYCVATCRKPLAAIWGLV